MSNEFDVMMYLPNWHWHNTLLVLQIAHVVLCIMYMLYLLLFKKRVQSIAPPTHPPINVYVNTSEEKNSKHTTTTSKLQDGIKTCRRCGTNSLYWQSVNGSWRLFDKGVEHKCPDQE